MVRAWTVAYHAAAPTKLLVRAGRGWRAHRSAEGYIAGPEVSCYRARLGLLGRKVVALALVPLSLVCTVCL